MAVDNRQPGDYKTLADAICPVCQGYGQVGPGECGECDGEGRRPRLARTLGNNVALLWLDGDGSVLTNFGWVGTNNTDLKGMLKSNADSFLFEWAGSIDLEFDKASSGVGIIFRSESTVDHAAPAANRCVIYTRDAAGKTQLVARFATGAVQVIAAEP